MRILCALVFLSISVFADYPSLKTIPIDGVFTPRGFDSNDSSEVVLSGFLPDLCHESPKIKSQVVGRKIYVDVDAYFLHRPGTPCAQVVVPFVEKVSLGTLEAGDYEIVVNKGVLYKQKKFLSVADAKNNTRDDYIYANVVNIKMTEGRKGIISGFNPSDGVVLDRIEWASNGVDTYSLLPIMKQIFGDCPQRNVPFTYEFEVPDTIFKDRVLIHVRKMGGMSLNMLYRGSY